MVSFGQPRLQLVRDHYPRVIREIMAEHGVRHFGQPTFAVQANTGFEEVLRYVDWYVAGTGDNVQHYRYDRYMAVLQNLPLTANRQAHVDVGCGAGLFSWVFLDWATRNGIGHDRIDLYGLDHCQAMLNLAEMARVRLKQVITTVPNAHYCRDVDALLLRLMENHRAGTDYSVTFGHVLIQAHTPHNIREFSRIIAHIVRRDGLNAICRLRVVDAHSGNRPSQLQSALTSLWDSLSEMGIQRPKPGSG